MEQILPVIEKRNLHNELESNRLMSPKKLAFYYLSALVFFFLFLKILFVLFDSCYCTVSCIFLKGISGEDDYYE